MFDQGFEFKLIQKNPVTEKAWSNEYIFEFRNKRRRRYIAIVEEYPSLVFALKFYPVSSKNNPNRFSILTNDFEATRVIRTCINIMLYIYALHSSASFAWIGVPTQMKNNKEGKSLTQRYRIYKNVMLNFFESENWLHYDDYFTSSYLLVNKRQDNIEDFLKKVIRMFTDAYPELEISE